MAYTPQSSGTTSEADRLMFRLLRQRSNSDRLAIFSAQHKGFRTLFLTGLKRRFGDLTPSAVATAYLKETYPTGFTPKGNEMTWIQDSVGLALQLHSMFERLEIGYYITGGVAAITYGEYRTTQDVDMVINVLRHDIPELAQQFEQAGFYVPGVEDTASGRMRSLQITHLETIGRADLMIAGEAEFDRVKLQRRQLVVVPDRGELYFASPEDVVLSKLKWRQQGQSEKQWRDILGILKVQTGALDIAYLQRWASSLGIGSDLEMALQQSDWSGFMQED